MKRELLNDICCPACGGSLLLDQREVLPDDHIVEGALRCAHCSKEFPIYKGIPYLLPEEFFGTRQAQEVKGWVSLWKKKGMYDHPTLEDSYRLPYVGGIWTDVARMFDMALQEMKLIGNEAILDLGAGQGWACRYFADKGCRAIAVDIVADEWYGLGRSWAIMEHAGVYFEPVVADGEALPFPPERFDIVFLCGALHHFQRFDRVLKQLYKVLKPGGRFIAAGEPSVAIYVNELAVQMMLEEVREGIVERRPKVFQDWWALWRAGFRRIHITTFETHQGSSSEIRQWIRAVRHNTCRAVRTRYKPLAWAVLTLILMLPYKWAGWLALHLNGGNLLLQAAKPMRRGSSR